MIKKLKRKFTTISMLSIFIVISAILGIINIVSYADINKRADDILSVLQQNDGKFPKQNKPHNDDVKLPQKNMTPEVPFETRYFNIYLDQSGNVVATDMVNIAAITTSVAEEMAKQAFQSNKSSDFIGNYKYLKTTTSQDKIMVIFIDCNREIASFKSFLASSLLVAAGGMIAVFIFVYIFSSIAIKPIVEGYEKQKRFITDASHEIKTPLTIIDANTEIIEMECGKSDWTDSTKNQVRRLTSLTNNLVSLARLDEENKKMQSEKFSLSALIKEETENFIPFADLKGKSIDCKITDEIFYVGDQKLIRQFISILLDNAIKYSSEDCRIEINLKKNGKKSIISVYNPVDKIEKGNLDNLFERFYRLDSSRNSQTGGYGIGLSLAKSIIQTHGGKILAKSDDGKSIIITAIL